MSGRLKMRLMGWITFINVTIGIALGGLLYTICRNTISNGIHPFLFFIGLWQWR